MLWAGGFLFNSEMDAVFLHRRDDNTPVNPNKWAFFGGLSEGRESAVECFVRELQEEIGLRVETRQVLKFREYMSAELNTYRVVFYIESAVPEEELVLGEGAGFAWISLSDVNDLDLADKTREDLEYFVRSVLRR